MPQQQGWWLPWECWRQYERQMRLNLILSYAQWCVGVGVDLVRWVRVVQGMCVWIRAKSIGLILCGEGFNRLRVRCDGGN